MNAYKYFVYGLVSITLASCKTSKKPSETTNNTTGTPVTITHIAEGSMEEVLNLNATSTFLLKTPVKSSINGYIQESLVRTGEMVSKGQKLFVIRTKEAENLGNTINTLDTSLRFKGFITLKAPSSGYIAQINLAVGDYIQEGEPISIISSKNSLVFLLEIPFELTLYLPLNNFVEVLLSDGRHFRAKLSSPMPTVSPGSQTQSYIIDIPENLQLPENLIANVKFVKQRKDRTMILPKEALLTNEIQSEFWIMKMIDSITAIKVVVKKGIVSNDSIEILTPKLDPSDKILLTGNYGLPDTAKVFIDAH